MKKQGGYLNLDIGGMLVGLVIITALIAAPLGWLAIEGLIWLWNHVSVSVK